jgi:hypothetical protein
VSENGEMAGTLARASILVPSLSPQKDRIAYTRPDRGGLCIHTFSSGHTICGITQYFVSRPVWSPDGSYILAVAGDLVVALSPVSAEILGSVTCQALLGLERPVAWPDCQSTSISSDGEWAAIAYAEGASSSGSDTRTDMPTRTPTRTWIYIFKTECIAVAECPEPPQKIPYSDYFAWAPQGDSIAVGGSIISSITGRAHDKEYPFAGLGPMLWSPDSGYLASTAGSPDGYSLLVTDLSTAETRTLMQLPYPFDLAFWASVGADPSTSQ